MDRGINPHEKKQEQPRSMGASLIRKSIKGTLGLACLHFDLVIVVGVYDKENQQDRRKGWTRASTAARPYQHRKLREQPNVPSIGSWTLLHNSGFARQPEGRSTFTDGKQGPNT